MLLLPGILAVLFFAMLAAHHWRRVFSEESPWGQVSIAPWMSRGLVVPCLTWFVLNCGFLTSLPPVIPQIAVAKSSGLSWIPLLCDLTVPGLLVIGSFWAAVSFIHLLVWILVHTDSRPEFAFTAGLLSVVLLPLAIVFWFMGRWPWAGVGTLVWLVPVTHGTVWLAWKPKPPVSYSRAIARMKLGKYREAESEVIQQLEQCEEDFDGWMMLAELYANRFGDIAEADRTVQALCDQPNITGLQISLAFHRLADWHLKLCDNPVAAGQALKEICSRLPESHFAKMAQLRIQQLPASRQEWLEQKSGKPIRLPALTGDLDEVKSPPGPELSRADAATLANECSDRLKRNPNDVSAREKLAIILTERLGKADLGVEQLQLLLGMTGQPEEKKAQWLSQIAAWRFRHQHDRSGAKQVLEQLIREHPQSTQGFAAQRWLNLLEMEERTARTPQKG
jgi:hypothetical protein